MGFRYLRMKGILVALSMGMRLGYAIEDMLISLGGQPGIFLNVGDGAGDEKISAGLEIFSRNKKNRHVF